MIAKEERAMHLEIHRMNRTQGDTIARNAALESECARLRMDLKHEYENHAATRDAATQRHNAYHAAENERIECIQRERQKMQEMMERMRQETISHRKANDDDLIGMKRKLDHHYAEIIDKQIKEFNAIKRDFEEECEQRMMTERKERSEREQEQRTQFLSRMEEANKMKTEKMRQLEEVKKHFEEECEQRMMTERKERGEREHEHRAHIAARMEEANKMKTDKMRQLEEAKKHFEEECEQRMMTERKERSEREHEHRAHIAARMEEANKMKTEKMRQLEEAKKHFEEECEQRMITERKERSEREQEQRTQFLSRMEEANKLKVENARQLEEERKQIMKREQDHVAKCASRNEEIAQLKEKFIRDHREALNQINETKFQLVQEKKELIAFAEKRFEEYVQSHTAELMKTLSFSQISHAVAANYAHTHLIQNLDFNNKRILIFSHYSNRDEVESYNYLTLEMLDDRFDFIIVLTNCPNKWELADPNYNKYHILSYNFKSDFRNYGVFIMQTAKTLIRASQVCFMNDSFVVVDVDAFGRCIKHLFESTAVDFEGITSSHEGVYHLQSYFMVFNGRAVNAIVDYFKMHGLPVNHNVSISKYELGITMHLVNHGFVPFAMVSNDDMQFPLNTTYCKWSMVLQRAGIVKRQHFLKQYPARFAMTDMNIGLIANKFSQNVHFIHFLKYHGIKLD